MGCGTREIAQATSGTQTAIVKCHYPPVGSLCANIPTTRTRHQNPSRPSDRLEIKEFAKQTTLFLHKDLNSVDPLEIKMSRQAPHTFLYRSTGILLLLLAPVRSFMLVPTTRHSYNILSMDVSGDENDNDPCWQSLFDDDCYMSAMYASNFVAGKWIQSMPCGEGIEVGVNKALFFRHFSHNHSYRTATCRPR